MIGNKSVVMEMNVTNKQDRMNPFKFVIQANKNLGIVDIQPRIPGILNEFQGRQINDASVTLHLQNVLKEMIND